MTRKVLVVGGSGIFGARLADGILATSDLDVVVAGRDRGRCEAFVAAHDDAGRARLSVRVLDIGTVSVGDLVGAGPTSGGRISRSGLLHSASSWRSWNLALPAPRHLVHGRKRFCSCALLLSTGRFDPFLNRGPPRWLRPIACCCSTPSMKRSSRFRSVAATSVSA